MKEGAVEAIAVVLDEANKVAWRDRVHFVE
jgi:hypothetical protein